MKILLSTLNSKYIHSNLSLWCLKAGVKEFCHSEHETIVLQSTINSDLNKLSEEIISIKPDLIAFSCYIWNTERILSLCKTIKERINTVIALGGPEVEFQSEQILSEHRYIDYILSGEGEWSFSSLTDMLNGDKSIENCEGISYIINDELMCISSKKHSETPPSPYCEEYFNNLNNRIAYIEASRGCPFRCTYCLSGRLSGLRYFDYESICNSIIRLSDSGTKTIKFIDRTFNADSKKANEILKFIKDNYGSKIKNGVCFHFELAADILTDETIDIFSSMPEGACQLEIGIQSFNNDTLTAVKRKSDLEKVYNNITKLISFRNMHIHTDLIAGLPYEDMVSFRNSFNKAFSLKSDMLQLGFLKLLHGAEIREESHNYSITYSESAPYEIYENKWLSHDDFLKIKACEDALDRLYNSGRFIMTLDYLISELKENAFDILSSFGSSYNFEKIALSDFVSILYSHFKKMTDAEKLREVILCDINSMPVNIHIPDELVKYDKRYKEIKKHYSEKLKKNVRIVILDTENRLFVVHTDIKNKISGRYYSEYYEL